MRVRDKYGAAPGPVAHEPRWRLSMHRSAASLPTFTVEAGLSQYLAGKPTLRSRR
jgi:hypothetical protein